VIPCRDDGRYLEEALASIAAQTLPEREVLVVDDGSTEAQTRQLFDSWSRSDARLVRLQPVGVSVARNLAIAQARGEFILPLDADDCIAPRYLERAVQLLEREPGVGIVECEAALFGDASGPWTRPPFRMPHFLLGNTIVPAALFRKTDFRRTRGYNPNMVHGWEDFDLWLSFLDLDMGVERLPETLFFYRQRPRSRSHRLAQDHHTAWAYARILLNHKRLYLRHPQILPRYSARMARAALRELTISSKAASSRPA
jgi:glycosyltransferase involved in cell wall biosynthesis